MPDETPNAVPDAPEPEPTTPADADAASPQDALEPQAAETPSDTTASGATPSTPTAPAPDESVQAAPASPAAVDEAANAGIANTIDQAELDALAAAFAQAQASGAASDAPPARPAASSRFEPPPIETLQAEVDDLAAEMAAAIAAESAARAEPSPPPAVLGHAPPGVSSPASAAPFEPPPVAPSITSDPADIELLDDVDLEVKIELGRTEMYIEDVLRLTAGSVVELDKLAGDPVDVYVNQRLVARGEVLVLNDAFCVRINSIQSPVAELERAS